jgi:hypothetical protein
LRVDAESESKAHVFVAMPFSEDFTDLWTFGICAPMRDFGMLCERMDLQAYTGDILSQIKERIRTCRFLIGVLTDDSPNVYLEIGYAWGLNKPTILLIKDGQKPRFDVQGQRYLTDKHVTDLNQKLTRELDQLLARD